jgi:N-ethylmaleimide reductase
MKLLEPIKVGNHYLKNRVFMAPLTRSRASIGGVPNYLNTLYYKQRASAGLIISEATIIEPRAKGYPRVPGIYTIEQINAWKQITREVHNYGGKIFCQLWHVGRVSHPDMINGQLPIAPSAISSGGQTRTYNGFLDRPTPRALEIEEIKLIQEMYLVASLNAMEAGFDGIELHGANGYLIDQFLCDGSNARTDQYGGSFENRFRFLKEIIELINTKIDSQNVGLRLSPSGLVNGMLDSNPVALFEYTINELNKYNLAYLHLLNPYFPIEERTHLNYLRNPVAHFRNYYNGILIGNSNYSVESAENALVNSEADAISFGKLFISNPDLVQRIVNKSTFSLWNTKTFYTEGAEGYTDYEFTKI